jgi:hypothetical protein
MNYVAFSIAVSILSGEKCFPPRATGIADTAGGSSFLCAMIGCWVTADTCVLPVM